MGTSRPSVVETNVCQSAGKASLAEVGLMAPSHERGFQKSSRALALSACSSRLFISTRRVESGTCPGSPWRDFEPFQLSAFFFSDLEAMGESAGEKTIAARCAVEVGACH